jgi:hypothetical protein
LLEKPDDLLFQCRSFFKYAGLSNPNPCSIMNPTHRAYSDFVIHYPRPLEVKRGDRVKVGRRDSSWSEWLWVSDDCGNSAWMHESLLQIDQTEAEVLEDFSAAEISVVKRRTGGVCAGAWRLALVPKSLRGAGLDP